MIMREIASGVIGFCGGIAVAAGVYAVITIIGLIPRLAGRTHTAKYARWYETCVILGGAIGNMCYVFGWTFLPNKFIGAMFGLFAGMFVGCLAVALAESLDTLSIFWRRVKLIRGLGFILIFLALGKMFGSLIYFYKGWFNI